MIGRTLGSYRIIEQIGVGGMATVYKAYDPGTDRYVAIKILPDFYSKDPTFRQRFEREAKAIAKLEHIHILPVFAYGEEGETAYLVMRYMHAGTLAERIGQGPLPLDEASRILTQVAAALDHAHKHGILHRDVKPSNVLIDADCNAFLTDFGIAKMVEGTGDLTGSGLLGTPYYMSPEQCQSSKTLTPASDQYSLGIVLYEMLTGRKPYQAETPVAVILMQLNDPLPSPSSLRPELTEEVERVIFKALAKQPDARYPTCSAMATAFARAVAPLVAEQAQASSTATEESAPTVRVLGGAAGQTTQPGKQPGAARRTLPTWLLALLALVVIAGGVGAAWLAGLLRLPSTANTLPSATPSTANPVVAMKGTRQVSICDDVYRAAVCVSAIGSSDAPIRFETGLTLDSVAWSPDGKQVVLTAYQSGADPARDTHLYIMSVQDGSLRRIENTQNNVMASWSPDGQWLAFHSSGALAIIRPDGADFRVLWRGQQECAIMPQWSPDSQKIVFTATAGSCENPPAPRRVLVVGLDGILTPVIALDGKSTCDEFRVAFSPDGRLIAYIDLSCHAALIGADGSPTSQTLSEFNMLWMGDYYPQWGGLKP